MKTTNFIFKFWIIVFLFFSFTTFLFSQSNNFAPIGAIWHFEKGGNCNPNIREYFTIESVADSFINGKNCRRLVYRDYDNSFLEEKYIYEDLGIVYYRFDTAFYPLYYFNVNIGDSISFSFKSKNLSWSDTILHRMAVVDTIYIDNNGTQPIQHYVTKIESFGLEYTYAYSNFVGHLNELIMESWELSFAGCNQYARCYADSSLSYRFPFFANSLSCNYLLTSTIYSSQEEILPPSILYSLSQPDQILVNFDNVNPTECWLECFDIMGNQVFRTRLESGQYSYQIPLETQGKRGVFVLQLRSTKTLLAVKKIVVY